MAVLKYFDETKQKYYTLPLGTESVAVADWNYSTEEEIIGCWVDGKPLYRRVFALSNKITISSSGVDTGINATYMETIVHGWALRSADDSYGAGCNAIFPCKTSNTIMAYNSPGCPSIAYIIIDYTKTTDAENSFNVDMLSTGTLDQEASDAEVAAVLS